MGLKKKKKSYLTPNEVAELLMVTTVSVRQWVSKGKLNAMLTAGGHRRFTYHEIERFARERGMTLQSQSNGILRILVVDDDVQVTKFLIELLKGLPEAIEVEVAHNGFEAGLQVLEFEPYILLLDLMMPGMDGFEVCQRLKENPNTKAIRVIAMTGLYTKENVDRICNAGAEICISKPINTTHLLELIGIQSEALAK